MGDHSKAFFKRAGFAVLRGQNWTYLLTNTHIIIGRKPQASDSQWQVDLDLGPSKFISRQHALLIYNFKDQRFEIRCLTKKGRVKVDGKAYRYQDGAVPLKHRSVISINKCSFLFVLPS
ncbi:unnamed protein product [Blepharisma stoltei]|uniref:FHA domain-containing protein n=1 Tax=Blepharisma stoltei TaxID=1481888 RepID=A0AAU9J9X3_9CILI|nr:unnamed protein product [Blepharisma stoltei]